MKSFAPFQLSTTFRPSWIPRRCFWSVPLCSRWREPDATQPYFFLPSSCAMLTVVVAVASLPAASRAE